MATNKELEAQVKALYAALERNGITLEQKAVPDTERGDYIELGSPKHATFLRHRLPDRLRCGNHEI